MGGVCLRGWGGEGRGGEGRGGEGRGGEGRGGEGGACFSSAIAHLRSHIAVLLPVIFRVVHFVCAAI